MSCIHRQDCFRHPARQVTMHRRDPQLRCRRQRSSRPEVA
jgi:hypothetical protein